MMIVELIWTAAAVAVVLLGIQNLIQKKHILTLQARLKNNQQGLQLTNVELERLKGVLYEAGFRSAQGPWGVEDLEVDWF